MRRLPEGEGVGARAQRSVLAVIWRRAAEAAEAAGVQGKFWPMHDMLFEHQDALDEEYLVAYAAAIGLDVDEFSREMLLGVHAPRVREDFLSGVRSGVNGTPTFFINGYRHNGSYDLQTAGGTIQVRLGVHNVPGGVLKAIVAVHDEGQGLYLARQIARMHGGDLWAESRGRMNGSTFILALPATG